MIIISLYIATISYSWDILSGCNKNKMLANIILYYKSQSVCVSVCVWVCSSEIGSQTMRTTAMMLLQVTK